VRGCSAFPLCWSPTPGRHSLLGYSLGGGLLPASYRGGAHIWDWEVFFYYSFLFLCFHLLYVPAFVHLFTGAGRGRNIHYGSGGPVCSLCSTISCMPLLQCLEWATCLVSSSACSGVHLLVDFGRMIHTVARLQADRVPLCTAAVVHYGGTIFLSAGSWEALFLRAVYVFLFSATPQVLLPCRALSQVQVWAAYCLHGGSHFLLVTVLLFTHARAFAILFCLPILDGYLKVEVPSLHIYLHFCRLMRDLFISGGTILHFLC
jgi:hypothetical protein